MSRSVVCQLRVVDVQVPELLHSDVVAINKLDLHNGRRDLLIHINPEQIHPPGSLLPIRITLRINQNNQIINSLQLKQINSSRLERFKREPLIRDEGSEVQVDTAFRDTPGDLVVLWL